MAASESFQYHKIEQTFIGMHTMSYIFDRNKQYNSQLLQDFASHAHIVGRWLILWAPGGLW